MEGLGARRETKEEASPKREAKEKARGDEERMSDGLNLISLTRAV